MIIVHGKRPKKKRRVNLDSAIQEIQNMANGSWHDFPLTQSPAYIGVSGTIGGEHTVGYYIGNDTGTQAIAQIVMCPSAVPPDAPPVENQAPNFHYAQAPIDTTQPQAKFDSSGVCTSPGWTPGGAAGGYYNVGDQTGHPTGTPPETAAQSGLAALQAAALSYAATVGKK